MDDKTIIPITLCLCLIARYTVFQAGIEQRTRWNFKQRSLSTTHVIFNENIYLLRLQFNIKETVKNNYFMFQASSRQWHRLEFRYRIPHNVVNSKKASLYFLDYSKMYWFLKRNFVVRHTKIWLNYTVRTSDRIAQ